MRTTVFQETSLNLSNIVREPTSTSFLARGLTFAALTLLAGCPIYPDSSPSKGHEPCGASNRSECTTPAASDCSQSGCPTGYICLVSHGLASCRISAGSGQDAADMRDASSHEGSTGRDATSDPNIPPPDASNDTKFPDGGRGDEWAPEPVEASTIDGGAPPDVATEGGLAECRKKEECLSLGASAKCLSGTCTASSDQCTDKTQCASGSQCLQGSCTPACAADKPCPLGYGCDLTKGICSLNPATCSTSAGCLSGLVCSQQHCVAPCTAGSDGGNCPSGLLCVEGGCVIDERPRFVCEVEGSSGTGSSGSCAVGSVCLHHNCYIACSPDAGNACKGADSFSVCKSVSTLSGTYAVCGSESNLGDECDPTLGKACSSGNVCIDGFCK